MLIWVKKKVQLSDFISHISHCTKLSWTLEINKNNSTFFLNLYIWKDNNRIIHTANEKELNLYLY
jgi:hypothetical protein